MTNCNLRRAKEAFHMIGLGTLINSAFVLAGGALGFLFGKALKDSYQDIMVKACGVSTIFIGASGAFKHMLTIADGQLGTTGDIYCEDDFGADRVMKYASGNEAVQALLAGKVDCVIIDNEPAKAYVAANTGLKILDTEFANEDYAICFSKKNPELQKKVNDALNELKASGEFQKVVDKYIKAN